MKDALAALVRAPTAALVTVGRICLVIATWGLFWIFIVKLPTNPLRTDIGALALFFALYALTPRLKFLDLALGRATSNRVGVTMYKPERLYGPHKIRYFEPRPERDYESMSRHLLLAAVPVTEMEMYTARLRAYDLDRELQRMSADPDRTESLIMLGDKMLAYQDLASDLYTELQRIKAVLATHPTEIAQALDRQRCPHGRHKPHMHAKNTWCRECYAEEQTSSAAILGLSRG